MDWKLINVEFGGFGRYVCGVLCFAGDELGRIVVLRLRRTLPTFSLLAGGWVFLLVMVRNEEEPVGDGADKTRLAPRLL
jgi:hypothetical protein